MKISTKTIVFIVLICFPACVFPINSEEGEEPSETECTASTGTYYCSWSNNGGDCSSEIVNSVLETQCGMEITRAQDCGLYEFSHTSDLNYGCKLKQEYIVSIGDDSILVANLVVNVECPDYPEMSCQHAFGMHF